MERRKALLIILDGLGDRAIKELGYKTPLQFAETPHLDKIARMSVVGLMDPIAPGIRAGSDTSHLNLLGYDPYEVYTGRGPFEAAGLDMDVEPGDVAFRCNFATVDDELVVRDRRAGRIKEGTHELAEALNGMKIEDVEFFVKEGVEHRAALIMRGPRLNPNIGDVDPHEVGRKIHRANALVPEAEKTARLLNEFVMRAHEILKEHPVNKERERMGLKPANILLPRGAGMAPHLENFHEKWGMRGACVVGTPLIRGICKIAGMDPIDSPKFTGSYDTDMEGKIRYAIEALEKRNYDFVLVNIKAPDIAGHDMEPRKKVEVIERIDGAMEYLLNILPEDIVVAVTADHSTPCSVGDHSGDPVPIMLYAPDSRAEGTAFNEVDCARGSLRIKGSDLMKIILNLTNRAEKFGA
ncbi:2,3-bisphosphoglycerate-independent phosphoglycerate mutase [Aciduliprofundum sp. MAR08-339]|uniref:2,3-bisphosphoglycerate-independent phosphoglycerate mutase n=1 Tax=Aciduliprofundum sp. (strain MAR08-339) TaxID=673860 RepID=UPI0002A4B444|nr:2,3-bisphosphoglycerate-independent phosphoglycerate mutase [Aciduliprofundum sp. MAR08-339]